MRSWSRSTQGPTGHHEWAFPTEGDDYGRLPTTPARGILVENFLKLPTERTDEAS